jgi:putative ABC transport system permease protein
MSRTSCSREGRRVSARSLSASPSASAAGRVLRQLIAESFVLAIAGGLLGAVLAIGGVALVREFGSPHAEGAFQISFGGAMLPRLHEIVVDGRVLGLAIILALVTALLVGMGPAFKLSLTDRLHTLSYRGAGGQGGATRGDMRLRDVLVVGQLAMATMLLVGAALLISSFSRLSRVDPGWNASGVLTFYLVMPQDYSTARKAELIERLINELRALPRVQGAGFTYAGPLLGLVDQFGTFVPQGRTPDEMRGNPDNPQIRAVSHDYLQTMGVRLIAGRWFDARDDAAAPQLSSSTVSSSSGCSATRTRWDDSCTWTVEWSSPRSRSSGSSKTCGRPGSIWNRRHKCSSTTAKYSR